MAHDGLVQVHYGQRKRMYYLQHLALNKCVFGELHKEDNKRKGFIHVFVYVHINVIVTSGNNMKVSGN